MQYRRLGRTDIQISEISLGSEYLIEVPRETVVSVVDAAIENGVNYIDMLFAPAYHRDNFGAALQGRRAEVFLSGHLGAAETKGQYRRTRDIAECERYFEDLLTRLKTDYVDVLFLSNCDDDEDYHDKLMSPGGLLDLACRYKEQGKARFIAFSGHKTGPSKLAVESGQIDVLMHSMNFSNDGEKKRRDLYRLCASEDVGLIAMKPFAGGKLLDAAHHHNTAPFADRVQFAPVLAIVLGHGQPCRVQP